MILVDTSIWIDHIHSRDEVLAGYLQDGQVLVHPFVTGELALGNLRQPEVVLRLLNKLRHASVAKDYEVLRLIEKSELSGSGIGYVDAHLLAAARLAPGTSLWTRDKRLHAVADRMGLAPQLH